MRRQKLKLIETEVLDALHDAGYRHERAPKGKHETGAQPNTFILPKIGTTVEFYMSGRDVYFRATRTHTQRLLFNIPTREMDLPTLTQVLVKEHLLETQREHLKTVRELVNSLKRLRNKG